jgi:hypothetical protein|tara:strand:- start:140 stop:331 length:192 start_codon:yes stop_codon:yes gene_type:complete
MIVVAIVCTTFLLVLVAFWIMPIKKMKAVSKELKSLLQVLPVTSVVNAVMQNKKKSDDTSKGE